MARIAGIDLPKNKRVEIALTYIYGIGRTTSNKILNICNITPDIKVKDLTDEQVVKLSGVIQKEYKVEGDLKREVTQHIRRLMDIGCWRGLRHKKKLPVRGQRTHTNARTRKGRSRIAVGVKRGK